MERQRLQTRASWRAVLAEGTKKGCTMHSPGRPSSAVHNSKMCDNSSGGRLLMGDAALSRQQRAAEASASTFASTLSLQTRFVSLEYHETNGLKFTPCRCTASGIWLHMMIRDASRTSPKVLMSFGRNVWRSLMIPVLSVSPSFPGWKGYFGTGENALEMS